MGRKVRQLSELTIDEISLVDKGANQHARTVIAKRHEENEMDEYFDAEGNPVDVASLELGDVVYDENGDGFEVALDEDEHEDEREEDKELQPVGKSANPFVRQTQAESSSVSAQNFRELFSKALTESDRDEVISKALDQLSSYEQIAKAAAASAEAERQLRLDREYTEVAKNYNVGVDPEVLGPVLKRAAESLSYEDCEVLAVALDSASGVGDLFDEIGGGAGSNSDVFDAVEQQIAKSATVDADAISKAFESNPDLYDEYLREQSGR